MPLTRPTAGAPGPAQPPPLRADLEARLAAAWARSDRIFGLLRPGALLERPIALRHPFVFYLGHLPAFAWNQLGRGACGLGALRAEFDGLFARGIDPRDTGGGAESDPRWPDEADVLDYRDRARAASRLALVRMPERELVRAWIVLEHELMHHETLLYMLQALDHGAKRAAAGAAAGAAGVGSAWRAKASPVVVEPSARRQVAIPAGSVRLGAARGSLPFGWDNEYFASEVEVATFDVDDRPVTNAEFAAFVQAGGYERRELWSAEAFDWLASRSARQPHGWRAGEGGWSVRSVFENVDWPLARHWPASVTWAEAAAFARWSGRRLMSEAEFRRAADAGCDPADDAARHAVLDFERWSPEPVGSRSQARSASGVGELVGNGWEWTSSIFAPLPGFRADLPDYEGYSADFFDGRHYVLLGGSWATDRQLVRRSFRNWYQPHYPYPFTKFRTAGPAVR